MNPVVSSVDSLCKQLGPGSDQTECWAGLDPNCYALMVIVKEFSKKVNFEIKQQTTKSTKNYQVGGVDHFVLNEDSLEHWRASWTLAQCIISGRVY